MSEFTGLFGLGGIEDLIIAGVVLLVGFVGVKLFLWKDLKEQLRSIWKKEA